MNLSLCFVKKYIDLSRRMDKIQQIPDAASNYAGRRPVMQEQASYPVLWLFGAIMFVLLVSKPGQAKCQ